MASSPGETQACAQATGLTDLDVTAHGLNSEDEKVTPDPTDARSPIPSGNARTGSSNNHSSGGSSTDKPEGGTTVTPGLHVTNHAHHTRQHATPDWTVDEDEPVQTTIAPGPTGITSSSYEIGLVLSQTEVTAGLLTTITTQISEPTIFQNPHQSESLRIQDNTIVEEEPTSVSRSLSPTVAPQATSAIPSSSAPTTCTPGLINEYNNNGRDFAIAYLHIILNDAWHQHEVLNCASSQSILAKDVILGIFSVEENCQAFLGILENMYSHAFVAYIQVYKTKVANTTHSLTTPPPSTNSMSLAVEGSEALTTEIESLTGGVEHSAIKTTKIDFDQFLKTTLKPLRLKANRMHDLMDSGFNKAFHEQFVRFLQSAQPFISKGVVFTAERIRSILTNFWETIFICKLIPVIMDKIMEHLSRQWAVHKDQKDASFLLAIQAEDYVEREVTDLQREQAENMANYIFNFISRQELSAEFSRRDFLERFKEEAFSMTDKAHVMQRKDSALLIANLETNQKKADGNNRAAARTDSNPGKHDHGIGVPSKGFHGFLIFLIIYVNHYMNWGRILSINPHEVRCLVAASVDIVYDDAFLRSTFDGCFDTDETLGTHPLANDVYYNIIQIVFHMAANDTTKWIQASVVGTIGGASRRVQNQATELDSVKKAFRSYRQTIEGAAAEATGPTY